MKSWYFNITVGGNSCVACIDCNQPFFMHVFRESGFKRAGAGSGAGSLCRLFKARAGCYLIGKPESFFLRAADDSCHGNRSID